MYLDTKSSFQEHLNILSKLKYPHLDYGDIIYNQTDNNYSHNKVESIQYKAALAKTGSIRGTSRKVLYQELGLEPLCKS